jgi:hypothetical protein
MLIRGQHVAQAWKDCSLRTETGCCLPSRPEIVQQPAKIDHPKTATALNLRSHSIDKLNRYDRRMTGAYCTVASELAAGSALGGLARRRREAAPASHGADTGPPSS